MIHWLCCTSLSTPPLETLLLQRVVRLKNNNITPTLGAFPSQLQLAPSSTGTSTAPWAYCSSDNHMNDGDLSKCQGLKSSQLYCQKIEYIKTMKCSCYVSMLLQLTLSTLNNNVHKHHLETASHQEKLLHKFKIPHTIKETSYVKCNMILNIRLAVKVGQIVILRYEGNCILSWTVWKRCLSIVYKMSAQQPCCSGHYVLYNYTVDYLELVFILDLNWKTQIHYMHHWWKKNKKSSTLSFQCLGFTIHSSVFTLCNFSHSVLSV